VGYQRARHPQDVPQLPKGGGEVSEGEWVKTTNVVGNEGFESNMAPWGKDGWGQAAKAPEGLALLRERLRNDPWGLVTDLLGSDGGWDGRRWYDVRARLRGSGGGTHPPGDRFTVEWTDDHSEYVGSYTDDGGALWIGHPNKWLMNMDERNARKLALFILRRELLVWGGLRRKIWYFALRKHLDRTLPHRLKTHHPLAVKMDDGEIRWEDPRDTVERMTVRKRLQDNIERAERERQ
jgi:hypothetical protein